MIIKNSPLEQAFYDALHTACASLETLKIKLVHQQIDSNFLLNHSQLKKLPIIRDLDIAFVYCLIQLAPTRDFDLNFQLKGAHF